MARERYEHRGLTGKVGVDGILTPEQIAKLNEVQEDARIKIRHRLNSYQRGELYPMVSMATGIGKGKIIHDTIEDEIRQNPRARILLIAGTKNKLVGQSHEALSEYQDGNYLTVEEEDDAAEADDPLAGQQKSVFYRTGKLGERHSNVHVGTIQGVQAKERQRADFVEGYDLVIVDEVHNIGTPRRVKTVSKARKACGFTATAIRHSGKLKKPEEYGFEVVKEYRLKLAQEDGLLPPLIGIQIDTAEHVSEYVPTHESGEINSKRLAKMLKRQKELLPFIVDKLAPYISTQEGKDHKTVIAVNYVWEAVTIAKLLFFKKNILAGVAINEADSRAFHTDLIPTIDSVERYKLPHDHEDALQVLISPGIVTEGFDGPSSEVFAWASPTISELRYSQGTGRLPRRANGKSHGTVIDFLYRVGEDRYTYNMGRWMPGDVVQLPNGLLYLGAERDRHKFEDVPYDGAKISLRKLSMSKGESEKVQPGELMLLPLIIDKYFEGNRSKIYNVLTNFFAEQKEHPDYFTHRKVMRYGRNTRLTATPRGREALVHRMQEAGITPIEEQLAKLRQADEATVVYDTKTVEEGTAEEVVPLEQLQASDLPITEHSLTSMFCGSTSHLKALSAQAIEELREENPEWFEQRVTGGGDEVAAIIDGDGQSAFIFKMMDLGVQFKE